MTRLSLALLLCLSGAAEGVSAQREARLVGVSGPVYVHLDAAATDEFVEAEEGMPVEAGDEIRTGTGGSAELALDGTSLLAIGEDSDLVVSSLDLRASEFRLDLGTLLAKIKSLAKGENMRFKTPSLVAAVRGTELGVSQTEGQPARVAVFDEGRVAVSAEGQPDVTLAPNQETEYAAGAPLSAPRALGWWKTLRPGLQAARARVEAVRAAWRSMPAERRRALRAAIRKRRGLARKALRGVRQRRQELREQRRTERREGRRAPRERLRREQP